MREEELHNALGETVRDLRASAGYSQEKFAYAVGMHRTYVGSIERGERDVGLRNLAKIAGALGMPASRLIALAEEKLVGGSEVPAQGSRNRPGRGGFGPRAQERYPAERGTDRGDKTTN